MTKSVFLSTISLSVRHIITDVVGTAATSGTKIYYNPDFIAAQSISQLTGLMAHECWHIAFQHSSRRGNRDPVIWNYSADFVINLMLTKAGIQLPNNGLLDDKYKGMSTDEVYSSLKEENAYCDPDAIMLDIQEKSEEDNSEILGILVKANTQSTLARENFGGVPGEVIRVIDKLLNPKVPWQILLNRFLDQKNREEYSWARRNRRYEIYLPSRYSHGLGHLTVAIDTSGSMSDEALKEVLSEIKNIQDIFYPEKMTIIDCDYKIHNVYEIEAHTDILSLEFTGSRGTSFTPVMKYVTEHPTQALIYFTDLYAEMPKDPGIPIIWICNTAHPAMPFGETIYIDKG